MSIKIEELRKKKGITRMHWRICYILTGQLLQNGKRERQSRDLTKYLFWRKLLVAVLKSYSDN